MSTMITRAGWGARRPSGDYTYVARTRGTKIHYTGGHVSPKIVDDHRICLKLMADIQQMHMSGGRGEVYLDFGYNLAACCHRQLLMGRGPHHVPAANGAGLNTNHYAILALIGSSGFTEPNNGLLNGVRDGIEYLRKQGAAGPEIKGHRDGYATSCPGGPMYAWVKRGAPRPGQVPAPKPPTPVTVVWDGDVPRWPGRVLTYTKGDPMMHGEDVRVWQEKLARRGWTIDVDSTYGPQSAGVARGYRRGTGLPAGDIVDEATWNMTWSWRPPA